MLTGQKVGPFVIGKELGSGAMGTVYRGTHQPTGKKVAVKFMSPSLGSNERSLARFEREVAILKQLNHPNIVRCFGASKFNGMPYYAMDYIEGESLDHVMSRRGRITWEEVVALGQQLCSALYYAHQQGIIHRDLKPSNLMLLPDGTLKLTDFGIAKDLDVTQLTSANCTVGTASYMSPEQCRGERDLTFKSDLYSLGVMFYELLVGKKPFNADNAMDMFLQHVHGTFERPARLVLDIPVWLDTLVCQLLEKRPEQRPRDAEMVSQVLGGIAEKVAAQQSAGVDAVRKRLVDRQRIGPAMDQNDKQTARLLMDAKFRVKRRKKVKPFYERKWFQALTLSGLLVVVVALLAWLLMPPGPDKVYAKVVALTTNYTSENSEEAVKQIAVFKSRFPDDPRIADVMERENQVQEKDVAERLDKMIARRKPGKELESKNRAEELALQALRYQEFGDPYTARDRWAELHKTLGEDRGPLRRLAERRVNELDQEIGEESAEGNQEKLEALVKQKLDQATELKAAGKRNDAEPLFKEIQLLYKGNPNPKLNQLAQDAELAAK